MSENFMKSLSAHISELRRLGLPLRLIVGAIRDTFRELRKLSPAELQVLRSGLKTTTPEAIVASLGSLRCTTCGHRELLTEDVVRQSKKQWPSCCGVPMIYETNAEVDA